MSYNHGGHHLRYKIGQNAVRGRSARFIEEEAGAGGGVVTAGKNESYDSTGLKPREMNRSVEFSDLSREGQKLSDKTVDSDFEYGLRRATKDAFDYFRQHCRWDETIQAYTVMKNLARNGFKKVSCVLCSKPIDADIELLQMLHDETGTRRKKMPGWQREIFYDKKEDRIITMKEVVAEGTTFDHKGQRANRNDGTAPYDIADDDPDFDYRWGTIKENDKGLIGNRRLIGEALEFAREEIKSHPDWTIRDLRDAVFDRFREDISDLYNHHKVVGVAHHACNQKDGAEYGKQRHEASREEVLARWHARESYMERHPYEIERYTNRHTSRNGNGGNGHGNGHGNGRNGGHGR